ncbi:MAG: aminotransferase class I/II-fold pyridoxal phosphate-dependent enzyme [Planctomycetota bacterium]|jgi:aspartate/methionine/tyrosine aminotransferase
MSEWTALKECGIFECLSQTGKAAFLPPGIFYWAGRARNEAEVNASIGAAFGPVSEIGVEGDGSGVFYLPTLAKEFANLPPAALFSYAPILGAGDFRSAWREWILEKLKPSGNGLEALITNPVVAPGVTGALAIAARLFLSPGEALILPDRYWPNYDNVFVSNVGARIVTYPFYADDDFNVEALKVAVEESLSSQGKAVVLLNFPNNPTGFTPSVATARRIAAAIEEAAVEADKWVIVMSDDAYEGFYYSTDCIQYSLFAEFAGRQKTLAVKLDGLSKEFLWYGARIGCITFGVPEALAAKRDLIGKELDGKLSAFIRGSVSNCNHPVQSVIAAGLKDKLGALLAERQRVIDVLKARWEVYNREIQKADPSVMKPLASNSGFFALVDLVSAKAEEVADLLITKYKVAVVPNTSAGQNSLRIALCSVSEKDVPRVVESVIAAAKEKS